MDKKLFCCMLTSIFTLISMSGLLLTDCSMDLAGGTGVGNPSGVASVSIVADTGVDAQKIQKQRSVDLPIMDKDSLILIVEEAYVVVSKITFILEDKKEGGKIDGPFLFDALNGTATPSVESLTLPAGTYTGLKLHVHNKDQDILEGYTIVLNGKFTYKDVKRNFSFKLDHNINPLYENQGPAVIVNKDDATTFLLILNADKWLIDIPLKENLDNGTILLEQNGDLVIDSTNQFRNEIRTNIIESGLLFISPTLTVQ